MSPWWQEMVSMIQTESDQELDAKLQKRIDKALDVVMDRLENGDFQLNQRTGEITRMPVKLRDAGKVVTDLFDKRSLIRKNLNKPEVNAEAVADVLAKLASQFAEFANYKKTRIIEHNDTGLQIRIPELPRQTETDQESFQASSSETPYDETAPR